MLYPILHVLLSSCVWTIYDGDGDGDDGDDYPIVCI